MVFFGIFKRGNSPAPGSPSFAKINNNNSNSGGNPCLNADDNMIPGEINESGDSDQMKELQKKHNQNMARIKKLTNYTKALSFGEAVVSIGSMLGSFYVSSFILLPVWIAVLLTGEFIKNGISNEISKIQDNYPDNLKNISNQLK